MSRLCSPSKAQAKQSLQAHPSGPTPPGAGQTSRAGTWSLDHGRCHHSIREEALSSRGCTSPPPLPRAGPWPHEHGGGWSCSSRDRTPAAGGLWSPGVPVEPELRLPARSLSERPAPEPGHASLPSCSLYHPVPFPSPRSAPHRLYLGAAPRVSRPSRKAGPLPVLLCKPWAQSTNFPGTTTSPPCWALPAPRLVRNCPCPEGACCPHPRRPSGRSLWPQAQGHQVCPATGSLSPDPRSSERGAVASRRSPVPAAVRQAELPGTVGSPAAASA